MNSFKKPFYMSNIDDFQDFDSSWGNDGPGPMNSRFGGGNSMGNPRYEDAYGDYQGGYGPGGGFGPRGGSGGFGGPPGMPPSLLGPPDALFPPGPWNFGPTNRNFGPPRGNYNDGENDEDDYQNFDNNYGRYGPGKGFGPFGPPQKIKNLRDKVTKYLARCGVPKEYMKNLPPKLVHLIEPHSCGICGHEFESFQLSRIHYISKNHLKKQKKYAEQLRNEGSSMSYGREVPLKARELYCELCDVHITSKPHSDSHYAGRAHRSVVEGRKPPRNPNLLQACMEGRLEQLIRREKRSMKNLLEEPEEIKVKKPEPVKPGPPELYCAICKTAVTCTEQMTMHLNGKKHLTREKQHILKMMSGQSDDTADNEDNNDTAADDDKDVTAADDDNDVTIIEDDTGDNKNVGASTSAGGDNTGWDQGEKDDWKEY